MNKERVTDLKVLIKHYTYMKSLSSDTGTATDKYLDDKLTNLKAEYKQLTGKEWEQ